MNEQNPVTAHRELKIVGPVTAGSVGFGLADHGYHAGMCHRAFECDTCIQNWSSPGIGKRENDPVRSHDRRGGCHGHIHAETLEVGGRVSAAS